MENKNSKLTIAILIGIMCMFLTLGISVQIKTVKSNTTTVGKTQSENQLRDSVLRWKEKYDSTYSKLETEEAVLETLRNDAANSNGSASDMSTKLEKYNLLLGYSDLVGKGVIVTLKDGDSTTGIGLPTNYIVHDEDLIELGKFVETLENVDKFEILPYHTLGEFKWHELGIPYSLEGVKPPTKERVQNAKELMHTESYTEYMKRIHH